MFATKKKPDEPASQPSTPAASVQAPASQASSTATGPQPATQAAISSPTGARKFPDDLRSQAPSSSQPGLASSVGARSPAQRPSRLQALAATSSVLNPHLAFEGNLRYTGSVTVDCEFRGSIVTEDTLIVGSAAKVTAEVTAAVVEISGKVHGNVRAKTRVKILTGGEVYGNIETPTISMDDGVVFEGNCSRPAAQTSAPRSASSSASDVDRVLEGVEQVLSAAAQ
jgi:cytoskeletal protein CcmA (bactofilin family)